MILQHFNWLAIVVSALAYFCLGAIWFNQKVFGTIWMKGHGITGPTEEDKKKMPMIMLSTLVLCFVAAVALAYFIHVFSFYTPNWQWYSGVKVAMVGGIGFAGVAIAMNYMYTRKPFSVIIIDSLYHVIGLSVAGIILSAWR